MSKVNNEKSPLNLGAILIRTAGVLFCLLMISVYLMSGLFARYVSSDRAGDTARVAAFHVNVTGLNENNTVLVQYSRDDANDQGDFQLYVQNQSEVTVKYNVKVVVDRLPFDIRVKLGDQELYTTLDENTDGPTIVDFGTLGQLPAGGEATHPLTFTVVDWNEFTRLENEASREESVDFTVCVDVVQVD